MYILLTSFVLAIIGSFNLMKIHIPQNFFHLLSTLNPLKIMIHQLSILLLSNLKSGKE